MTSRVAPALFVGIVASVLARAEPSQFLCIGEHSAGLHYDAQAGGWEPAAFAASRKYIIRHLTADDQVRAGWWWKKEQPHPIWGAFNFGNEGTLEAVCSVERPLLAVPNQAPAERSASPQEASPYGLWFCHSLGTVRFDFDPGSLRFQLTYGGGYIGQGSALHEKQTDPQTYQLRAFRDLDPINHPDDAFFEIGTCSPF